MKNRLVLLILLVCISCIRSQKREFGIDSKLIRRINTHFDIQNTKGRSAYLLIPLNGCSVCIEPAIQFAIQNCHNNENIFFIVSDFGIKPIKIAFDNQIPESNNIIPDPEGYLFELEVIFNNPVALLVENDKVQSKIILSSQNSKETFKQISLYLSF